MSCRYEFRGRRAVATPVARARAGYRPRARLVMLATQRRALGLTMIVTGASITRAAPGSERSPMSRSISP